MHDETSAIIGKADIHIHSDHSDGLASIPQIMEYVQHETDLDVIAITDHNTIDGALFAKSLEDMYDFEVVVAEEVSSREGHVIGLYLHEAIPAGMSALDTIRAIEEQEGIVVIPHPFSAQGVFGPRGGKNFLAVASEWAFDAFEVFNSLPYLGWANGRAASVLSAVSGIAATGGSDAHVLEAVGKCYTLFPGHSADDLRESILRLETRAEAERSGLLLAWLYCKRLPRIRRMQSWNWERCKAK